ncbi:MAG: hypothetical protein DI535_14250 [Citrobacter freundii]|nr:MAG: hypothetical protein DI535_14250 [Citrobacter freundii]
MYTKLILLFVSTFLFFCACTPTKSFLYTAKNATAIYKDPGLTKKMMTVPAGRQVLVEHENPWGLVYYEKIRGYTDLKEFRKAKNITRRQLKHLLSSTDSVNVFAADNPADSTYKPATVGSGSANVIEGVKSIPTSGYKPVAVKGYTRKDGTYVKPHTRSAPRRR